MHTRSMISLAGALCFMVVPALAQGQYAQPGQSSPLPAGAGKALVEGICTGCHPTDQITRSSGYTREGWRELILTMIDLSASPDLGTITEYLATHFPVRTHLQPTLVPGEAAITLREWQVPTARPAVPRPGADAGWGHLVGWTMGQPCRADQSRDR
jgi:virginiamycin B lyase